MRKQAILEEKKRRKEQALRKKQERRQQALMRRQKKLQEKQLRRQQALAKKQAKKQAVLERIRKKQEARANALKEKKERKKDVVRLLRLVEDIECAYKNKMIKVLTGFFAEGSFSRDSLQASLSEIFKGKKIERFNITLHALKRKGNVFTARAGWKLVYAASGMRFTHSGKCLLEFSVYPEGIKISKLEGDSPFNK